MGSERAAIGVFANAEPQPDLRRKANDLLETLLEGIAPPALPEQLVAAPESIAEDYRGNWNHQLWYHLGELVRIHEGRRERAAAQGGDAWINVPKPETEQELTNHLRELAKLRHLIDHTPRLAPTIIEHVLFDDSDLDRAGAWDVPAGLAIERDSERGVRWQGQNPGGDWFWLKQSLPAAPASIQVDLMPISTIKGGLILGFCAEPLTSGAPFSAAGGPRMSDYYNNFNAYHFSVHRGSSGYCNLRRCGPGLIMLASFDDPCPQIDRWYHLEIIKNGPQLELRVDRRLICCYLDYGYIQPALDGGHFGLRHFQGFNGWQRNVSVGVLGT